MDRFFYESEEYGTEPKKGGILSLSKQPGFNLRDVTDIIFDPSSKLDKALLPLVFLPPVRIAAALVKMGYKGSKLKNTVAHIVNAQSRLPRWALGAPGDTKGRILGGPFTGRRSYVQAQVLGETAGLAALPFSGEKEPEDFRTRDYSYEEDRYDLDDAAREFFENR